MNWTEVVFLGNINQLGRNWPCELSCAFEQSSTNSFQLGRWLLHYAAPLKQQEWVGGKPDPEGCWLGEWVYSSETGLQPPHLLPGAGTGSGRALVAPVSQARLRPPRGRVCCHMCCTASQGWLAGVGREGSGRYYSLS